MADLDDQVEIGPARDSDRRPGFGETDFESRFITPPVDLDLATWEKTRRCDSGSSHQIFHFTDGRCGNARATRFSAGSATRVSPRLPSR